MWFHRLKISFEVHCNDEGRHNAIGTGRKMEATGGIERAKDFCDACNEQDEGSCGAEADVGIC